MSIYILLGVLGLGSGAVYALLALGLVLQHRSSGVVNLAHGAVAMFVAYVFSELRTEGTLAMPWFGLPDVHLVRGGVALVPAIAISLAYAGVLGAVVYVVVFRPLRRAPVLGKVVASVGLMLTLQALATLKFGTEPVLVAPIFSSSSVSIDGPVPVDRLWLAGIAIALALVLAAVYRFTMFGLATRAAAEDEVGASLLGYSPERLALANWILAAVLAGLAGILIAPLTTLDPTTYTLFVIPALAAAVLARFASFPIAVLAALAIGIGQAEIPQLQTLASWLPQQGLSDALPLVVILIVLAVRGSTFPERIASLAMRPPAVPRPRGLSVSAPAGVGLGLVALLVLHGPERLGLMLSMITAIIALSLVILTGYLGQISLAQMSFAGLGGFALSKFAAGLGVPFPIAPLAGALCAVPLGLLVGAPALRIRGVQLAVVTLAAAAALDSSLFQNASLVGPAGSRVPGLSLFGINLDIVAARPDGYPRAVFGVVVLAVLGACGLYVARLPGTAFGRRLLAVRADERAAAASGINVAATKLVAFALSAFIAGLGGALLGYQEHVLSSESFTVFVSLQLIAVAYIGGITRVSGAVVGGLLLAASGLGATLFNQWFGLAPYQALLSGVGLVAMAVANPDGLVSAHLRVAAWLARRWRRAPAPPGRASATSGTDEPLGRSEVPVPSERRV